MSFSPKFEISSVPETPERKLESSEQWVNKIELSDDSENWQDSIELSEDVTPQSVPAERQERNLSRFEECEQVKQMVTYLQTIPEAKPENWINLSFEERVRATQKIENQAAKVGGRPALTVETASMNENNHGYMDWNSQKIVLNEDLLRSNKYEDFQQSIKTLLHEGRHAFQYSNISLERTEPNDEKYRTWSFNYATGYCAAKLFGFKTYYLQPLEVDARVYSESIVSRVMKG